MRDRDQSAWFFEDVLESSYNLFSVFSFCFAQNKIPKLNFMLPSKDADAKKPFMNIIHLFLITEEYGYNTVMVATIGII